MEILAFLLSLAVGGAAGLPNEQAESTHDYELTQQNVLSDKCVTPSFICFLDDPQPVGSICYCETADGEDGNDDKKVPGTTLN